MDILFLIVWVLTATAVGKGILFVIGLGLMNAAVVKFVERRENYESELENANYQRKTAVFWGISTEPDDQTIRHIKQKGYGTRWERFKFMAGILTTGIIGGLVFLFFYLNMEKPEHPWDTDIWRILLVAGVVYLFARYSYHRTIKKLERQIGWLEMMLKNVYSEAVKLREAPIENLQTRLNGLRDN